MTVPDAAERSHNGGDWSSMIAEVELLAKVGELTEVMVAVRRVARQMSGADGVCIVLRDGDRCHYVDEEAIGPLWKGRRFPMSACISGWCMLNRQTAIIPDIYLDTRIPHDAYRPTFVQSLIMVPVGHLEPSAAIGVYWARKHTPEAAKVAMLERLARAAATALARAG